MRLCLHIEVSIHASVKDATYAYGLSQNIFYEVSIHASVKDATKANALAVRAIMVSIHASVKDATYAGHHHTFGLAVSIHASVKDATRDHVSDIWALSFNPRICKRCDYEVFHNHIHL